MHALGDDLALRHLRKRRQVIQVSTFFLLVRLAVQAREAIELQDRARDPEEIEAAFEGKLFEVLTQHHPVCSR